MASIVDETENVLVLLLLLALAAAMIWTVTQIPALSGFLKNLVSDPKEALKQASDAAGGAGYPGQPEYVSPAENIRRWMQGLFGGDDGPDAGAATEAEQQEALNDYVPPTQQQAQQAMQGAASELQEWFQNLQSNPGSLALF